MVDIRRMLTFLYTIHALSILQDIAIKHVQNEVFGN